MRTSADALRSVRRYMWRAFENDVPPPWRGEQRSWEARLWGTEGEFGFPFIRVAQITPTVYTGPATWREATATYAVHVYPVPMADPEASIMELERVQELLFSAFEEGVEYLDPLPSGPILTGVIPSTVGALSGRYFYTVTAVGVGGGETDVESSVSAISPVNGALTVTWETTEGAHSYRIYRSRDDNVYGFLTEVPANGWPYVLSQSYFDSAGVVDASVNPPLLNTAIGVRVRSAPRRIPLYDYDGVPLDGVEAVSSTRGKSDYLRVLDAPVNRIVDPEDDTYWLLTVEARVSWRRSSIRPELKGNPVESVILKQVPL